ncbi:MAG TPA: hypothetical protein VIO94_06690 [Phenylobacterium sp.]
MSEYLIEEDEFAEEPENEVVQWMAAKPLSVGAQGLAAAVSAAFVIGALTAVGVLAALRWIEPRGREDGWRPSLH